MNTHITYTDKIEMSHCKDRVTHTFNTPLRTSRCMQPISADKS